MASKNARALVEDGFNFQSDSAGYWSYQQMDTAAGIEQARAMRRIADALAAAGIEQARAMRRIADALDNLLMMLRGVGSEGLHEIIRLEAKKRRAGERRRLAKAREAKKREAAAAAGRKAA